MTFLRLPWYQATYEATCGLTKLSSIVLSEQLVGVSIEPPLFQAAEQAHFSTVHLKDALVKLAGHLAAEPDIRRYSVVR